MLLITPIPPNFKGLKCSVFGRFRALQSRKIYGINIYKEVNFMTNYQELAEHYGTAILPARVRAPKDKTAVEGTVSVISTFVLTVLRHR